MRRLALVLMLAPALASADQVTLKGGRRLTGVIVEKTARSIVMDVGPGRIALPLSQIESVEAGGSALASYRARAAGLSPGDANGWLDLAFWAREAGLETQALDAFAHVLALDPGNGAAHAALGHVQLAGRWVSPEESYRAHGLVPFEGSWISPAEREAILQERAASRNLAIARVEAEARAREAEARARAAEAEAQRAEAAQRDSDYGNGIPYGLVLGGGCSGWQCGHVRTHHRPPPPRPSAPPPTMPPPRRDTGSVR